MKTIIDTAINDIVIKNSKFITIIKHLNNENEVIDIISKLKQEYKNASHYCYAYILDDIKRYDDDKEPSGTAGLPILNVLEKNDLNYVICIVIRYFGGIKLGAGGLIRAYGKSIRETLNRCSIAHINECYYVTISFNYDQLKNVDYIIKNCNVINKNFDDLIKYTIQLKNNELDLLETLKLNNINIDTMKKDYFIE